MTRQTVVTQKDVRKPKRISETQASERFIEYIQIDVESTGRTSELRTELPVYIGGPHQPSTDMDACIRVNTPEGHSYIACEFKEELNDELYAQGARWEPYANQVYLGYWKRTMNDFVWPDDSPIGLLYMNRDRSVELIRPARHRWRGPMLQLVERAFNSAHPEYCPPAGSAAAVRARPSVGKWKPLIDYVHANVSAETGEELGQALRAVRDDLSFNTTVAAAAKELKPKQDVYGIVIKRPNKVGKVETRIYPKADGE